MKKFLTMICMFLVSLALNLHADENNITRIIVDFLAMDTTQIKESRTDIIFSIAIMDDSLINNFRTIKHWKRASNDRIMNNAYVKFCDGEKVLFTMNAKISKEKALIRGLYGKKVLCKYIPENVLQKLLEIHSRIPPKDGWLLL